MNRKRNNSFLYFSGILTRAVHSTRRHALEIQSNLKLLRLASILISRTPFNFRLRLFIERIQSNLENNETFGTNQSIELKNIDNHKNITNDIRCTFEKAKLFKTMIFNDIRFTTITYQIHARQNDSCVLFKLAKKIQAGFITSFIQTKSHENNCIIRIRHLPVNRYLTMNLNGISITCNNIMFSNSEQKHSYYFVKPTDIVEKLAHVYDDSSKSFLLFRFPNMVESS
jgi:Leucine-rich repeat (LRR) protein